MSDHALILLVDDSEDDVFLIRKAFAKAKVRNPIHAVSDGEEAIAYLNGEGKYENREEYPLPILILLDLSMPRMDGFGVLRWIRAQPDFSNIPVLVLTHSEQLREVNEAYALGANSFLTKPGDFENYTELARILSEYWMSLVQTPESRRPRKRRPDGHPSS
jgi:CheY-like chemotaxis protein